MPTLREIAQNSNIKAEFAWDESLARHTSYKIGGPAELFARPGDADSALALVAIARANGIPLFVLGGGANILVGDKGIRGIVMDTSGLRDVKAEGRTLVAGAGMPMDELCLQALAAGLGGLEDFTGLPGSVGGAVYMNARCYEREMSQVLTWVLFASSGGGVERHHVRAGADQGWSYKRSPWQPGGATAGGLILEAAFRVASADDEGVARIASVMRRRRADREAKGHYRLPSAGSVFKNDRAFGAPTGVILDRLGMRGRRIGDAMVAPWHANIFVNAGRATATDMRALIELAQSEARGKLGLELETEVLIVGDF